MPLFSRDRVDLCMGFCFVWVLCIGCSNVHVVFLLRFSMWLETLLKGSFKNSAYVACCACPLANARQIEFIKKHAYKRPPVTKSRHQRQTGIKYTSSCIEARNARWSAPSHAHTIKPGCDQKKSCARIFVYVYTLPRVFRFVCVCVWVWKCASKYSSKSNEPHSSVCIY